MSVAAPAPTDAEDTPAPPPDPPVDRGRRAHLLVALAALALATWVMSGLWRAPYRNGVAENIGDQGFFEWIISYGPYLLRNGGDPFFTDLMNVPLGVNLAANTSITVYAVLFAPLTMLAGPQVTFAAILTLNLAGSAFAWYLFVLRWVTRHRAAAAVAGLFCGFAPGFVSHANGHLNWTAGWIAPVVLWWMLRLREPGRWLRNGTVLGLLIAGGFTIAAEGLFFTAMAGGIFVVTWSLARATRAQARAELRNFVAGLGVTATVSLALLAYPLYMHFAGPQTFSGTGFSQRHYAEDLVGFFSYSDRTLAAWAGLGNDVSANPTEQTSYFGLPLVILVIVSLRLLWKRADPGRRATLRALMVVGAVFFVLSLGTRLRVFGGDSYLPMPYALLAHLPLFDSALPARFALALVGVFGVVLAWTVDELLRGRARPAFTAAFALALVPILPSPVLVSPREPEPAFIRNGTWKRYLPEGGVLSALPFASNVSADGQRWQAYTMARGGRQFRIPGGYFLGPDTSEAGNGRGRIGAAPRATDWLFLRAGLYGYNARFSNWDRAQARADFKYWDISLLVLPRRITGPDGPLSRSAVVNTAVQLLGQPEAVDDVLIWRIRPGQDPADVPE